MDRDFIPQHVSQLGLRKGDIVIQDEVGVESVGPEWRHVRHTVETVRNGPTLLLLWRWLSCASQYTPCKHSTLVTVLCVRRSQHRAGWVPVAYVQPYLGNDGANDDDDADLDLDIR